MKDLEKILGEENLFVGEPMAEHTTFRIGGPADYYAVPTSEEDLIELLYYLRRYGTDYYVIGNGSNILVKDNGYRGVIVDLSALNTITVEGEKIRAGAGARLKDIASAALEHGLTGYEFASGIPGTLGGGIRMNAGAYGGEHSDVVESARVLTPTGEIHILDKNALDFSYRHSVIMDEDLIVLSAEIRLKPGERDKIKKEMRELARKRREKQPLEYPSAGSTFKRPEGYFAGKLIQDIGYKGKRVGGAQVSEKHSGFVINTGEATAEDVLTLIGEIQERIKSEFGVDIEREVIVIGE